MQGLHDSEIRCGIQNEPPAGGITAWIDFGSRTEKATFYGTVVGDRQVWPAADRIAAASKDAHPAAIIREANAVRRVSCLHVDARIQEQRDAKSRNQQPRRVSPEMASKPRDVCHGALLSQCPPLTW